MPGQPTERFLQLTMDHSLVNDMLMHGEITKEEAVNFPKKNVLTNALRCMGNGAF
jgi:serine/threonine protein phosphatase PrpC